MLVAAVEQQLELAAAQQVLLGIQGIQEVLEQLDQQAQLVLRVLKETQ
jgi:hypothetical protein